MFEVSKYNPKELGYIVDPKTEEEMIAISRAIKVIEAQRAELGRLQEQLQEFAEAKAEGRLVVLPCKVGDTVFVGSLFGRKINEYTITGIKFDHEGCLLYVGGAYKRAEKVFLTREEAEKALGGGGDA